MTTWNYIKGSEKDFESFSDKVVAVFRSEANTLHGAHEIEGWMTDPDYTLIAQRERVTTVNDDRLAHKLRPRSIHHPDGNVQFGCIQTPLVDVDMVNHPSHYTQGDIECIDAIKAATVGKTGIEAVCVANVIKYLWRYEEKNGPEDVKKARWYLERLISELNGVKK